MTICKDDRSTLLDILQKTSIIPLTEASYDSAHDQFAYVAVRDTLLALGVTFNTAERLARENAGKPRERLKACLAQIC